MKNMLPDHVDKLMKRYERSAVLKGLVQVVPFGVGAVADSAISAHLTRLREGRARAFFDELESGEKSLTPELVQSNDFLHCFMSAYSAALRTHRQEKIRALAKLLISTTAGAEFGGVDDFEEYLKILDELSFRELQILRTLDRYEASHPKGEKENDLQRATRYWEAFAEELEGSLGIPRGELNAMMTRLNRTGCYETFTGGFMDYTGGKGKLTQTYFRLKSIIERHGG